MSNSKKGNDKDTLSVDVAKDIIELQKQEIEIKREELSLRSKEIDNSHEYALEALDANKTFYAKLPAERRKDRWQMLIGALILFVFIVAFFIYLFETGQGDLAAELIKVLAGVIFGGGAGYGLGFHKGRKYQQKENEDD